MLLDIGEEVRAIEEGCTAEPECMTDITGSVAMIIRVI
jgi:hypothetical protein